MTAEEKKERRGGKKSGVEELGIPDSQRHGAGRTKPHWRRASGSA